MTDPNRRNPQQLLRRATLLIKLAWDFTESDISTFVIPNTAFGIAGLYAAAILTEGSHRQLSILETLQRLIIVAFFNWSNVLVFDLANQRGPESIQEDLLNKPWRPIPAGKCTADQARRAMLVVIPTVLALNYVLGVWRQGVFIQILNWLYNDIRGGDELTRDVIISFAYGMFNSASLEIAVGCPLSHKGIVWTAMISGVILTTMQVQDLKDQAGDRSRGRRTVALYLGEQISRVSIAFFVCFWSCTCAYFWRLQSWAYIGPLGSSAVVAWRVLSKREPKDDSRTWKCWCFWTVTLYVLPFLSTYRA